MKPIIDPRPPNRLSLRQYALLASAVILLPAAVILLGLYWKQIVVAWHVQQLYITKGKARDNHLDALVKIGEPARPQFEFFLAHVPDLDPELYNKALQILQNSLWGWPSHRVRIRSALTQYSSQYYFYADQDEICKAIRETLFDDRVAWNDLKFGYPLSLDMFEAVHAVGNQVDEILGECLKDGDCLDEARAFSILHLSLPAARKHRDQLLRMSQDEKERPLVRVAAAFVAAQTGQEKALSILQSFLESPQSDERVVSIAAWGLARKGALSAVSNPKKVIGDLFAFYWLPLLLETYPDTRLVPILEELVQADVIIQARASVSGDGPLPILPPTQNSISLNTYFLPDGRIGNGHSEDSLEWLSAIPPTARSTRKLVSFFEKHGVPKWFLTSFKACDCPELRNFLIGLLDSPHHQVRVLAACWLMELRDRRGIDVLVKEINEGDFITSSRICLNAFPNMVALGKQLLPLVQAFINQHCKDSIYLLGQIGDPFALPFLEKCLQETEDPSVARAVLRAMLEIEGPEILTRLRIEGPEILTRLRQIEANVSPRFISDYGLVRALADDSEAMAPVIVWERPEPSLDIVARMDFPRVELALYYCAEFGPLSVGYFDPLYLTLLRLPGPRVTECIVKYLETLKPEENFEDCLDYVLLLGIRGDGSALPAMRRFATSSNDVLRQVARGSMVSLGAEASVESMAELTASSSGYVRAAGFNALAARWPERALPFLLDGMEHPCPVVTSVCQMRLASYRDPSIGPRLEAILDSRNIVYYGNLYGKSHEHFLLALAHAGSRRALAANPLTGVPLLIERMLATSGFTTLQYVQAFEALSGLSIGYDMYSPRRERLAAIARAEDWCRKQAR